MSKIIALTTGDYTLPQLSGNTGFATWFYTPYISYCEKVGGQPNEGVTPLHIVLPAASVGDWQDNLLTKLEPLDISRLHIEFQPIDHLQQHIDYYRENATKYRQRIISGLRERLERSNWSGIVLTGLTQEDCEGIIDLHLDVKQKVEMFKEAPVRRVSDHVSVVFERQQ